MFRGHEGRCFKHLGQVDQQPIMPLSQLSSEYSPCCRCRPLVALQLQAVLVLLPRGVVEGGHGGRDTFDLAYSYTPCDHEEDTLILRLFLHSKRADLAVQFSQNPFFV
jgi:hypothetical protein